jgi:hypothetical protein
MTATKKLALHSAKLIADSEYVTDKKVTYFIDTLFTRLWEGIKENCGKGKKVANPIVILNKHFMNSMHIFWSFSHDERLVDFDNVSVDTGVSNVTSRKV